MERLPIISLTSGNHVEAVKRFLSRFRFREPASSLEHITAIARAFSTIPYENVSKIIRFSQSGEIAFRMPEEVYEDHRQWHLGGTCFSLTYYLLEILRYFGYQCAPVMGDMHWGENVHSVVLVTFQGERYLVDPGYMIHRPVAIAKDTVQRYLAPHAGIELRFRPEDDRFDLFTFRSGNYTWRYRFTPQPVSLDEFSAHWIASFFQPTLHGICLTRTSETGMIYVHNDFTKISGQDFTRRSHSRDQTEKVIREHFGIPLHLIEEARYALTINRRREQEMAPSETD